MQRQVVAVVGYSGSGMSTVTEVLKDMGFHAGSGGQVLRDLSDVLHRLKERYSLIELADALRAQFGPAILMQGVAQKLERQGGEKFVFDSIRNPWEVAFLKERYRALVIGVNTPDNIRLKIMKKRGKEGDPTNMDELYALNVVDGNIGQPWWGQNIPGLMGMADVVITNNFYMPEPEVAKNFMKPLVEDALVSKGCHEGQIPSPERR